MLIILKQLIAFCLAFCLFFFIIFPLSCVFYFFSYKQAHEKIGFLWKYLFKLLLIVLNKKISFVGGKFFTQQALYFSNHQSFLDILIVGSYSPFILLMKKELRSIPIFGFCTSVIGCVSVDRNSITSRRQAQLSIEQRLKEGFSIHFYPEGTRRKNLQEFSTIKIALFHVAYNLNIPVIPLVIKENELRILDPIYPENFLDYKTFSENAWNSLQKNYFT